MTTQEEKTFSYFKELASFEDEQSPKASLVNFYSNHNNFHICTFNICYK